MSGITDAFEQLVKIRQGSCEHLDADKIYTAHGIFCGTCGVKRK